MKVVHISSSDSGGAGLAALRIHLSLCAHNVDSVLLVADRQSDYSSVIKVEKSRLNSFVLPSGKLLSRIKRWLHRRGCFQTELEKDATFIKKIPVQKRTFFTTPISSYDLRNNPIIRDADIIHLHWIEGFVDYRTFFPGLEKPIVWTFHDENIGFGGFHYKREYDLYHEYYDPLENKYYEIKKRSLMSVNNLTMISLSTEMDAFCHHNSLMADRRSVIIPNSVNHNKFIPLDKSFAKSVFKIPAKSYVVSFCAYEMSEPRKGLLALFSALEQLDIPNLVLLCIGGGDLPRKTTIDIYRAGYVVNDDILSLMYSASNLFVMPSYQEAFAQTPLEALSCGTPVVAFPVSGTSFLINEDNGVRCRDFSVEALREGIQKAFLTEFDVQTIREDIRNRFSPELIASKYINVYNEIISNNYQQE